MTQDQLSLVIARSNGQCNPWKAKEMSLMNVAVECLEKRIVLSSLVPVVPLASFDAGVGQNPAAGVVVDSSGNLFGTTTAGGSYGDGTLYEIPHGTTAIDALASFNGSNGSYPEALTLDSSGNLFFAMDVGGDASGVGAVIEVPHGTTVLDTLATSADLWVNADAQVSISRFTIDANGNLFGTTSSGGNGFGAVFELVRGSGTVADIAAFNQADGEDPQGSLVLDSSGNLFGATCFGGEDNDGTVFEIASGSGSITALASFTGDNGDNPQGGLDRDGAGYLFGTTSDGGPGGFGTVFEIPSGSQTIDTLVAFGGSTSYCPQSSVVVDSSGNLFGAAYDTAAMNGRGMVYEVVKGSHAATTLLSLNNISQYGLPLPENPLTLDNHGESFRHELRRGADSDGMVFELAASATTTTTGGVNVTVNDAGGTYDATPLYAAATVNGSAAPLGGVYPVITYLAGATRPARHYTGPPPPGLTRPWQHIQAVPVIRRPRLCRRPSRSAGYADDQRC